VTDEVKQTAQRLAAAIEDEAPADVHVATDALREAVEASVEGRELTPGSVLVERKRRLHTRLHRVDDAAAGDRWDEVREAAEELGTLAEGVVQRARRLPPDEDEATPWTGPLRNAGTVARKEAVLLLRGTRGWLLFGLLVLTFGIGLESALGEATVAGTEPTVKVVWNYAHSLDFLALPLAGILVGYGLVNEELTSNTLHVLAAQPVSRAGIAFGKFLGMAAALAVAVAASSGLVGAVAYAATGELGRPVAVFIYPVACYLLALAFGTLSLVASALIQRTAPTLAAGFGAFVLLGPVWQNAFLTSSLERAGQPASTTEALVYLATPFTAWWNWTSELLGPVDPTTGLPRGEPWHATLVDQIAAGARETLPFYASQAFYAAVLVAWIALALAAAWLVLERRDLG